MEFLYIIFFSIIYESAIYEHSTIFIQSDVKSMTSDEFLLLFEDAFTLNKELGILLVVLLLTIIPSLYG